jgi:DNA-binding MarR family transcriptional regulator
MASKLEKSVQHALNEARHQSGRLGSSKTREQQEYQAGKFVDSLIAAGYVNLQSAAQIKEKHVRAVIENLVKTHNIRTCQNYARTARMILRGCGQPRTETIERLTSASLGIGGASRDGKKTALPDTKFAEVRAQAQLHPNPQKAQALVAVLDLMRYGGLRIAEVRHIGKDVNRHLKTLEKDGHIYLRDGIKTGRPRYVRIHPENRENLRAALKSAAAIRAAQGGHIWAGKNGRAAAQTLYTALRGCGLEGTQSSHALRYAFCRDQFARYIAQGYIEKEALIECSRDLGHGDGRGQYVKQVYLK